MNFSERMLAIENKVIDFLTIFTWWIEVRFDKNNIHMSLIMSTWESLFFALMFVGDIPDLLEKKRYIFLVVISMCTFLSSCGFLIKIVAKNFFLTLLKRQNPQGTPNPCRIRVRNSLRRRFSITLLVFGFCFVTTDYGVSDICFLLASISYFLSEFFIACDSLPPAEKSRRKVAHELQDMTLAPVPD